MYRSRLEQYLDELERPMGSLPEAERSTWREEARQHLLSLIAAHEELGSAPDAAVEAALRSFGDARRIGQQVRRASRPAGLSAVWQDTGQAFLLFGPVVALSLIAMIPIAKIALAQTDNGAPSAWLALAGACAFVAVPLIGGVRVGRRLPGRRPGWRIYLALALAALLFTPIAALFLLPALGWGQGVPGFDLRWGLLWLPMAGLSAHRTARRANRRRSLV